MKGVIKFMKHNIKPIFFLILLAIVIITSCIQNPESQIAPQVAIVYPPNNTFVKDSILIIAEATDNVEVAKVQFFIDGNMAYEDLTSPYTYLWHLDTLVGTHTIIAKVWDNDDNTALSNIVNVQILDTTDTEAPEIAIISPGGWSTVFDTIQIATEVWDNRGVARVIFYIDGDSLDTDLTYPFICQWNTRSVSNTYHSILAKAIDFNQNWTNAMITVYVQNPDTTDNIPPQIAITSPAGWSTVHDTINVLTQVWDDRGIAKVVFYIDGDSTYTDLTQPYTFRWNTRSVNNDYHTILARAYDLSYNWANSMITVLVQNN